MPTSKKLVPVQAKDSSLADEFDLPEPTISRSQSAFRCWKAAVT